MLDDELSLSLKKRYSHVHQLVLLRSAERASDLSDLFDIMESIPKPPFSWDEEKRRWVKDSDVS
ncbi:hypothetical protein EBT16_10100, partial [bacterium]|nr:hypothetical protein [bacterium]